MTEKIILSNKKPNNNPILILTILILIFCGTYTYFVMTYDTYKTIGIIDCQENCVIKTNIPYDSLDIFEQDPKIVHNKKTYNIEKISYGEIYIESEIPYQEVFIETELAKEAKIIELDINYNKQRIYKKIKDIIEGD